MISIEQIALRLNSGVALTSAESSLFLRTLHQELTKLKEEVNELKVSVSKPRVDSATKTVVPASTIRRKDDS